VGGAAAGPRGLEGAAVLIPQEIADGLEKAMAQERGRRKAAWAGLRFIAGHIARLEEVRARLLAVAEGKSKTTVSEEDK
jgi:hypothetical protein